MFDLMPFGYERSLLDSFDNFEKEFFKGMNRSLASFRTDIQDKGQTRRRKSACCRPG